MSFRLRSGLLAASQLGRYCGSTIECSQSASETESSIDARICLIEDSINRCALAQVLGRFASQTTLACSLSCSVFSFQN